jgi:phosphoribosylanthranilate isomerase
MTAESSHPPEAAYHRRVTRAKICGITRAEDAEHAVEHGAWALGFILWARSPRACDPALAAGIARSLRRRAQLVGVFVNPTLEEVVSAADAIGLTHLQLHGEEGPAFCEAVARRTGCRVIKAARVAKEADVRGMGRYRFVDFHLLDSAAGPLPGGSGLTWDWRLLAGRRSDVPLLLSGGLTPETVGPAIHAVRPWGVDVASGVEAAPGVKDPARVEGFLAAVRAADAALERAAAPAPSA